MALTDEQRDEIAQARDARHQTRRPSVPALEEMLFTAYPVLDHGFVRVVDYMGDDAAIVQAARVSYGRGTRRVSEDTGLIRYLMRHRHSTPFEMCEIKYHVKLPIFVARQWIRHRMANINEYSARYSILDREFYIPDAAQLAAQSTTNHQGRGETLSGQEAEDVLHILRTDAAQTHDHYLEMLNEHPDGSTPDPTRQGLARELARNEPNPQHLHPMVLENRPPQPPKLPRPPRRQTRPVRNPRLRRNHARNRQSLGPRHPPSLSGLPPWRHHSVYTDARGRAQPIIRKGC